MPSAANNKEKQLRVLKQIEISFPHIAKKFKDWLQLILVQVLNKPSKA